MSRAWRMEQWMARSMKDSQQGIYIFQTTCPMLLRTLSVTHFLHCQATVLESIGDVVESYFAVEVVSIVLPYFGSIMPDLVR